MISRILSLARKELIELFRQPLFVPLLIISPILQVVLFGYLFIMEIRDVPMQVVNPSGGQQAQRLVDHFSRSPLFRVTRVHTLPVDGCEILRQDAAKAVLMVEEGAGTNPRLPRVQVLLDGVDSNTSVLVAGYARRLLQMYFDEELAGLGLRVPLVYRPHFRYNPLLRSVNFMGPALVVILFTSLMLLIGSVCVVREREQQTLDLLLVMPLRPLAIYVGKVLPVAGIALLCALVGLGVVVFWFAVPMQGSLGLLLLALIVYMPGVLALSMLISILTRSQQEALFFAWFITVSVMIFSGFLTPVANMPVPLQVLSRFNPTYYLMRIVRGIFLKASTLGDIWPDLMVLAVLSALTVSLSLLAYRRMLRS